MSAIYGESLKIKIFGQSHSELIGVTMEGLPAGLPIDREELMAFLSRRAPGRNEYSSPRREADIPEFAGGLSGGVTDGGPLTVLIRNTDARPEDYRDFSDTPRPGHADYTAYVKYGGGADMRGGGAFSGRLTAPLCAAGGICVQMLRRRGIRVFGRCFAVGGVEDEGPFTAPLEGGGFPCVSPERAEMMRRRIAEARAEGDSVGGIAECVILGVPAGLGGPLFEGLEGRIAQAVFAIPAVKGLEFGGGFALAEMRGSAANDPFAVENGRVVTLSNNCGGLLGGISDGMPIVFRAAFKPTPSIARPQRSVSLSRMENAELLIRGRHDPCIVPRAVPCVESAAALALCDTIIGEGDRKWD